MDLILLNDVETEYNQYGFLPGDSKMSQNGEIQSVAIAKRVSQMGIAKVLTSDAQNLSKLIHHIRVNSKNNLNRSVTYTDALRDRNFGVLSGTPFPFRSEIFTHSRICPEKGESVEECRIRCMSAVKKFCSKHPKEMKLAISHPFVCQILSNAWGNQPPTDLSDFWFKKGAYIMVHTKKWEIEDSGNCL